MVSVKTSYILYVYHLGPKSPTKMTASIHSSTLHSQIKKSPNNFIRSSQNGCYYFAYAATNDSFVKVNSVNSTVIAFYYEAEEICRNNGQILWSPTEHRMDRSSLPDISFSNIWTGIKRYNTSHFYYNNDKLKN